MKIKGALFSVAIIICVFTVGSFNPDNSLQKIKNRGELVVITDNNAHGYYLYKNQPMGFEFDLAQEFANFLNVKLSIVTPGWEKIFDTLLLEDGDLIASSLTQTPKREARVTFSDPYMPVQQQVIIHQKTRGIKKLSDLNGKTIHIRKNTSYHEQLLELQKTGIKIHLALYENVPTEEFLSQIQSGEILITIADSNIFRLNRRYYPDLRIAFPISDQQSLGWAIKKNDIQLLNKINAFFKNKKTNGTFGKIYNKYYAGTEIFDYVDVKKFHIRLKTKLPAYRQLIEEESEKYNFDWRLITAVIYQESHFNPNAKSYTGVRGLMQLTRITAAEMGVENRLNPTQSIKGGIKYLNKLYNRFNHLHPDERIKFALASYNVGYGHIKDAQKIARDSGLDINQWSSIEQTLPLLRYRQFYEKSRHGYARGTEPVRFVKRILKYYDILKMTPDA